MDIKKIVYHDEIGLSTPNTLFNCGSMQSLKAFGDLRDHSSRLDTYIERYLARVVVNTNGKYMFKQQILNHII